MSILQEPLNRRCFGKVEETHTDYPYIITSAGLSRRTHPETELLNRGKSFHHPCPPRS